MADMIQLRRDTVANWAAANPVLAQGEIGIVIDLAPLKLKIGNGTVAWNELDYFASGTASSLADLTDVDMSTAPAGGQSLVYDTAAGKWKPGTIAGGGTGIANLVVNANGDLVITLTDNTVINAGHVVGEQGPQGATGPAGADGTGAGDMTKAVYDSNNSGKVDAAETADSVVYIDLTTPPTAGDVLVWDDIDSKFKPSGILNGLEAALAAINGV